LLRSLEKFESVRNRALDENGSNPLRYPRSNEGWIATLCVLKGRALDRIALPFALTVGHAVAYTCLQQLVFPEWMNSTRSSTTTSPSVPWSDVLLGVVLNSTLIFMLVFRLNRAADRFWTARALWGSIVAEGRTMVGGIIVHGSPLPPPRLPENADGKKKKQSASSRDASSGQLRHRDHAVRWTLAFFLAAMESLRGRQVLDGDMFAGILLQHEVLSLQDSVHMPLYCVHRIRHHLRRMCVCQQQGDGDRGDSDGNDDDDDEDDALIARATAASRTLTSLEAKLDSMMNACGGAERIRATPLPIVYVAHLRTILLLTLLLLPYIYGPVWGWSTIGVIAVAAFVWLGIEGTAREVENPFGYRVNDLPMDGYCKGMMATTIQELRLAAEEDGHGRAPHRNFTLKP
jgi:putative membrane protein